MKSLFSKGSKNGVSDNTSLLPCSLNLVAQQMLRAPRETIQIGTATNLHFFAQAANPPATAPPVKKDLQVPQISPLEKRLQDMGSIRGDGSDKFYGMENVSSRTSPESVGIAKVTNRNLPRSSSMETLVTATQSCNVSTTRSPSGKPSSTTHNAHLWTTSRLRSQRTYVIRTRMHTSKPRH